MGSAGVLRRAPWWAVTLAILTLAGSARAQKLPTCVRIEIAGVASDTPRAEGLRALVESELDRHPTHRAATEECDSHLLVELVEAEGRRYLTGRINWQVPHRVEVEDDDLATALTELLRVVLGSDPLRLRAPGEQRGFDHALRRLKRDSLTLWGVEAFEIVGFGGGRVQSVPGIALRVRRELEDWHVGVRLAFGARPAPPTDALTLRAFGNLSFELAHFFSQDANASGYLAGLVGVEHHWLAGPLRADPNRFDDVNSTGAALGVRGGVELFRLATTRLDLFAQLSAPLFVTRDEADAVMKRWFPTATVGAGASF